jgi:threonine/homoserine/homoserine lactone efflux protein
MTGSTFGSILAFSAVAAVLVLTPGVGTVFLSSTVLRHGRRSGYLTANGMLLGAVIHALAAGVGTAVLLREYPAAIDWIAFIGGAFIVLLGSLSIIRAIARRPPDTTEERTAPPGHHSLVTTGLIITMGNAPLPLFYLVVVPQYIPSGFSRTTGIALLSLIHIAMAGAWMVVLIKLVGRIADVLRRPAVLMSFQVVAGVILVLLGLQSIAGSIA